MKIEKAKSEQIEILAKEIWNEHYIKILSKEQIDYMLQNFQSQKAIENQIKDGYNYFVMKIDGKIMGYTGIVFQEEKMFLSKLYIKKEARNKGVGKTTLEFLK
ncbi:MAG: GNAT family N-acetyltransferase, partial [Clostridia bacterium]|nr:GNAT family N-acetyltransferase [Clostridia bacterium]